MTLKSQNCGIDSIRYFLCTLIRCVCLCECINMCMCACMRRFFDSSGEIISLAWHARQRRYQRRQYWVPCQPPNHLVNINLSTTTTANATKNLDIKYSCRCLHTHFRSKLDVVMVQYTFSFSMHSINPLCTEQNSSEVQREKEWIHNNTLAHTHSRLRSQRKSYMQTEFTI